MATVTTIQPGKAYYIMNAMTQRVLELSTQGPLEFLSLAYWDGGNKGQQWIFEGSGAPVWNLKNVATNSYLLQGPSDTLATAKEPGNLWSIDFPSDLAKIIGVQSIFTEANSGPGNALLGFDALNDTKPILLPNTPYWTPEQGWSMFPVPDPLPTITTISGLTDGYYHIKHTNGSYLTCKKIHSWTYLELTQFPDPKGNSVFYLTGDPMTKTFSSLASATSGLLFAKNTPDDKFILIYPQNNVWSFQMQEQFPGLNAKEPGIGIYAITVAANNGLASLSATTKPVPDPKDTGESALCLEPGTNYMWTFNQACAPN